MPSSSLKAGLGVNATLFIDLPDFGDALNGMHQRRRQFS
jgi:hypothetical protein